MLSLLSHYYQPLVEEGIDELAMTDWIGALGDIPQAAIDGAAAEWVRDEEKRPTPAGIRKRALARLEPRKPPPIPDDDEWPFGPEVVPSEELERRREMQEKLRREYPMLKRIETIGVDVGE